MSEKAKKEEIIEEEEVEEDVEEEEEDIEEEAGDKEEEPVRFELKQPEVVEEEEETVEIIHKGQPYKFTKDKIIELAQKGFDYDYKVGPHGKLVQMIEADPEIAELVNKHWQKKLSGQEQTFKVKPITEYEDESEWLQDNISQALSQSLKNFKPAPAIQPQDQGKTVENALKMRDPEYSNMVIPKLGQYASRLSVSDYKRVDSDMGALCQFYDFVKAQELAKVPQRKTEQPGFRVKSGGGEAPGADTKSVWNLSKDEFQKQLDRIKGF